jgi:ribosomal protein L29
MADEKKLTGKEIEKKMKELKIELLKQPTKRKGIKREIARLLTVKQNMENKK